MKTIIIIPTRLASTRFPGKPLALIDGIPMIQRVWEQAMASKIGDVIVACAEKQVADLIASLGGNAIMTSPNLPSGTDRVYSAIKNYSNLNKVENIINLQGDMPIINPEDIKKVNYPLKQGFEIGTLVTDINAYEEKDINITKVKINWIKKNDIGEAVDFYKDSKKDFENIYQHVGIYSFKFNALKKFVNLLPSRNELDFKLEQWRALDANMTIGVNYVMNAPISVDTKEDLLNVERIIKKRNS